MSDVQLPMPIFCCSSAAPVPPISPQKLHFDPNRELHNQVFRSFIAFSIRRHADYEEFCRLFFEADGLLDLDALPARYRSLMDPRRLGAMSSMGLAGPPKGTKLTLASILEPPPTPPLFTEEALKNNPLSSRNPYVIHLTSRHDFGPVLSHRYFVCPDDLSDDWKEATLVQWFAQGWPFNMKAEKWDLKCADDCRFFRLTLRPNLNLRGAYNKSEDAQAVTGTQHPVVEYPKPLPLGKEHSYTAPESCTSASAKKSLNYADNVIPEIYAGAQSPHTNFQVPNLSSSHLAQKSFDYTNFLMPDRAFADQYSYLGFEAPYQNTSRYQGMIETEVSSSSTVQPYQNEFDTPYPQASKQSTSHITETSSEKDVAKPVLYAETTAAVATAQPNQHTPYSKLKASAPTWTPTGAFYPRYQTPAYIKHNWRTSHHPTQIFTPKYTTSYDLDGLSPTRSSLKRDRQPAADYYSLRDHYNQHALGTNVETSLEPRLTDEIAIARETKQMEDYDYGAEVLLPEALSEFDLDSK